MARLYATADDYQGYTGQTPPADIDARLARASRFLDSRVLRLCWYQADASTGMPTDSVVLEAVRDAACALVQWWDETGDELGVIGQWGTVRIGSVSLGNPRGGASPESQANGESRTIPATVLEALRSPDLTPDRFRFGEVVAW